MTTSHPIPNFPLLYLSPSPFFYTDNLGAAANKLQQPIMKNAKNQVVQPMPKVSPFFAATALQPKPTASTMGLSSKVWQDAKGSSATHIQPLLLQESSNTGTVATTATMAVAHKTHDFGIDDQKKFQEKMKLTASLSNNKLTDDETRKHFLEKISLFEQIHQEESTILELLKACDDPLLSKNLFQDLYEMNKKKKGACRALLDADLLLMDGESEREGQTKKASSSPSVGGGFLGSVSFFISQQPADFAVANRYLMPPPTVLVQNCRLVDQNSTLIVSAHLFYHDVEEEMMKTQDGKQEVLQGIKKVTLDKNGRAIFNKLKIMEVSSKHKHQAFCLVFFLEEYTSLGAKRILSRVKSAPFHVQSRSNKRKREGEGELFDPAHNLKTLLKTASSALHSSSPLSVDGPKDSDTEESQDDLEKSNESENDQEPETEMEGDQQQQQQQSQPQSQPQPQPQVQAHHPTQPLQNQPQPHSQPQPQPEVQHNTNAFQPRQHAQPPLQQSPPPPSPQQQQQHHHHQQQPEGGQEEEMEGNYIDITDLLVLPQKEAARRLGISESMLCKRFKECTRRKWPYRYLRKIEKVINLLSLPKLDGAIPKEDKEKLDQLRKERDECLHPVKIRITAHDKLICGSVTGVGCGDLSLSAVMNTSINTNINTNHNTTPNIIVINNTHGSYLSNENENSESNTDDSNGGCSPRNHKSQKLNTNNTNTNINTNNTGTPLNRSRGGNDGGRRDSTPSLHSTSAPSPLPSPSSLSSSSSPASSTTPSSHHSNHAEDEIPTDVLETLEMLKSTKKKDQMKPPSSISSSPSPSPSPSPSSSCVSPPPSCPTSPVLSPSPSPFTSPFSSPSPSPSPSSSFTSSAATPLIKSEFEFVALKSD